MKRTLTAIAMLCAALAATAQAQTPDPMAGAAHHVTIMDGASGAILYCHDCETPMPPASMSKLMTVEIVADEIRAGRINMNTRFRVSENAWRHGAMSDGSHMFLDLNSEVTVGDLLRGLIIVSANDAGIVLAEGIAGSEAAFVQRMNARAREMGLRSAHFVNVTGLPVEGHVISSADLARLARHLMTSNPGLYNLYSQRSFTYNNRTQENRNPLLGAAEGADGVKTGHTADSGYGLIGSAVRDGQRRIIVFNGTNSMAERRSEGLRLINAAFSEFSLRRVASANQQVGEAQVWLGSRRTVPLLAQQDIIVGGPARDQNSLTARIVYDGPIHPPITEGAVVAHLVVEGPNFTAQRFPLVAGRNIGRANWFARAWEGLLLTLSGPS
ncbi:MAG: D-alanyl-D-alanine carboxypeptidase family protein [Hyphomonadaceae bacterium]|nr:D-alanyl-D-alanine carboxypeptidase family protein [Hyphomonadaceae bacterium]